MNLRPSPYQMSLRYSFYDVYRKLCPISYIVGQA